MATAAQSPVPDEKERKPRAWQRWALGLILIAAIAGAALHFGQIEQFAMLLQQVRPLWLVVALALQVSTYAFVAGGWYLVLRAGGSTLPLHRLFALALAKLFTDQAVPAAGMGGNVLMVNRLIAVGVPRGNAAAALILSVIGYYAGFSVLGLTTLVLLWLHHRATWLLAGTVSLFLLVCFAIPALALWLQHRGRKALPRPIARIKAVRRMLDTLGEAPADLVKDKMLLAEVAALNALVFVADAATLSVCLRAVGTPEPFASAYIALIMAQIAVVLGPVPLGLGAFEGACIGMLRLFGTPFEAAFAATMLLRGFTLWLPLIPGLIITRRMSKWGEDGSEVQPAQ